MSLPWKSIARRLLAFVPHKHNLSLVARKHGTDKYANGYIVAYQHHFQALRRRRMKVLELGVGGGPKPERGGASLRMWRDYFPNSQIYGLDIYDKSCHEGRRIKIYRGDQNDSEFLKSMADEIGPLDIVIDDGSHINEHVMTSFRTLFPRVKKNGIYVVEDLCTAYWPEYGGEWQDLNSDQISMVMFKKLVEGLHYYKIPNYTPSPFDRAIVSLHFYHNMVFVQKGENPPRITDIDQAILDANRQASADE